MTCGNTRQPPFDPLLSCLLFPRRPKQPNPQPPRPTNRKTLARRNARLRHESARGRWPPSVFTCVVGSLSALAFLHLPFAFHFLHSTLYSPFSRLSSCVFFRSKSFEMIGFGDDAHSAMPGLCQVYKVLDLFFSSLFSHRFWNDF